MFMFQCLLLNCIKPRIGESGAQYHIMGTSVAVRYPCLPLRQHDVRMPLPTVTRMIDSLCVFAYAVLTAGRTPEEHV